MDADRRRYRRALAATTFDGQVYLFAAGNGADDVVYSNRAKPGEAFMGWEPVGGTTDAPIAATAFDDHLYIFRKGQSDHGISYNVAAPGQPFTGWSPTLGTTAQAVTATMFKGACISSLAEMAATSSSMSTPSSPACPSWASASRIFLIARGSNNHVYYTLAPPGEAFAPLQEIPRGQALQGPMITDAAPAATIANGLLYVVVKSPSQGIWIATADGF